MNSLPKISIIVPVYNVEKYLRQCIESILTQTYTNLEIIIVNDGSTDESGKICSEYASMDSRIKYISQENHGISMARNTAIDVSTGEYIGFIDGDDWIAADMYDVLYENAVNYSADISECSIKSVDEGTRKTGVQDTNISVTVLEGIDKIKDNMIRSTHSMCNKLFHKQLFEGIRLPKGKIYEDLFTTYKLIDKANRIVVLSKEGYYYVSHPDSITRSSFNIRHMDVIDASIERYHYITNRYPNLERECRNYILSNLIWGIDKAYKDGFLENHIDEIKQYVDIVKVYDFNNCAMTREQINTLRLIFSNLKTYIAARKMFNK